MKLIVYYMLGFNFFKNDQKIAFQLNFYPFSATIPGAIGDQIYFHQGYHRMQKNKQLNSQLNIQQLKSMKGSSLSGRADNPEVQMPQCLLTSLSPPSSYFHVLSNDHYGNIHQLFHQNENYHLSHNSTILEAKYNFMVEVGLNMLLNDREDELLDHFRKNPPVVSQIIQQQIGKSVQCDETHKGKKKNVGQCKNIPKNFGKQIIKYIKNNRKTVQIILTQINSQVNYETLYQALRKMKYKMGKISSLLNLWKDNTDLSTFSQHSQQFPYGREMRVISNNFFRKECFHWIFNSRVESYAWHIKYKGVLERVLRKAKTNAHSVIGQMNMQWRLATCD